MKSIPLPPVRHCPVCGVAPKFFDDITRQYRTVQYACANLRCPGQPETAYLDTIALAAAAWSAGETVSAEQAARVA